MSHSLLATDGGKFRIGSRCIKNTYYNYQLYKLFHDVSVSKISKLKRLQWAGHVECMDEKGYKKNTVFSVFIQTFLNSI